MPMTIWRRVGRTVSSEYCCATRGQVGGEERRSRKAFHLDLVGLEGRELSEAQVILGDHHEAHPQAHIQRAEDDQEPRAAQG
eukprot:scaffold70702_cov63-Phaeocystis_antarctica.AAC.5